MWIQTLIQRSMDRYLVDDFMQKLSRNTKQPWHTFSYSELTARNYGCTICPIYHYERGFLLYNIALYNKCVLYERKCWMKYSCPGSQEDDITDHFIIGGDARFILFCTSTFFISLLLRPRRQNTFAQHRINIESLIQYCSYIDSKLYACRVPILDILMI